jgi:hypothetical protein
MADSPQDLKDQTLAQLDALRSTLASADWQTRMLSASPEQKQQSSDAQILADARIAQLEDVQLGQIDQQIDADAPALNDAIAGMQRALGDLQDAAKVLVAASALLKVVGRVLTSVALDRRRAGQFSVRPSSGRSGSRPPIRSAVIRAVPQAMVQPMWPWPVL